MKERPLAGVRLTLRNGLVDSTLEGGDFDEATVNETTRWSNGIMAAVRLHQVGKPNQLAQRRLTRQEADRALRYQLRRLAEGGDL